MAMPFGSLRSLGWAACALVGLGLAGCGAKGETKVVTIKDYKYDPETITIKVGDSVKWVNRDEMKHSATRDAAEPKFDTGVLDSDQESAAITFDKESDATGWQYRCTVPKHESMKGFVVVKK
jgi:plastocyanin